MAQESVAWSSQRTTAEEFDSLIGPWIEPGYRLAIAMLGDADAAGDALQDSALRAWRSLHRLREPKRSRAWFLSIVANRCRSTLRGPWWAVVRIGGPLSAETVTFPEDSVVQSLDIDRAMRRLSAEDRAVLHLRFYLDLQVDEVARVLGIRPGAARSRIYRAAHRLRPDLSEEDLA